MLKKKDYNLIKSRRIYGKKSVVDQDVINQLRKSLSLELEDETDVADTEYNTLSLDISNAEEIIEETPSNNSEEVIASIATPIIDDTTPQIVYNDTNIETNNNSGFLNKANIEDIMSIINEDDSYKKLDTYIPENIINENLEKKLELIEENIVENNEEEFIEDNIVKNDEEEFIEDNIVENDEEELIEDNIVESNEEELIKDNIVESNEEDFIDVDTTSDDDNFLNKLMNVIDEIPSENLKDFTNPVETIAEPSLEEIEKEDDEIEDISDTKKFITDQSGDLSEIQKYLINLYTQNINEERLPKSEEEDYTPVLDEEEDIEDEEPIVNDNNNNEKDYILEDNNVLLISEKKGKVFLPYTIDEVESYLKMFPNKYETYEDVIKCEFILPLKYFQGAFTFTARFREAYALYKYREGKTAVESALLASKIAKKSDLHPAIIAACRSEKVLKNYIKKLDSNKLSEFKDFEIEFKINPTVA